MATTKPGKTVYLEIGVWYDEKRGDIHIADKDRGFITTVNANPASDRGHRNLFNKLAKCLRKAGVPAPDTVNA